MSAPSEKLKIFKNSVLASALALSPGGSEAQSPAERTHAERLKGPVLVAAADGRPAAQTSTPFHQIFKDIPVTDQTGRAFNPSQCSKGITLVVFGWGGCPVCQEMTKTLAMTQQKLLKAGHEVQVVVVSMQPEKDRDNMPYYVGGYFQAGMQQSPNDKILSGASARRAYGEKQLEAAKALPQENLMLHVLCPPKGTDSQEVVKRLAKQAGVSTGLNALDPRQHPFTFTLFKDGNIVMPRDKSGNPQQFSGAKSSEDGYVATPAWINSESDRILNTVNAISRPQAAPGRSRF